MHSGSNKLAVGILTLMGYDFKETERAYAFFSTDKKIVSFVPKKEFEAPMAKNLFETTIKEVYQNWCVSQGKTQVDSGLQEIYSAMFKEVDQTSKEYKLALQKNLIFDPEREEGFIGSMQEALA